MLRLVLTLSGRRACRRGLARLAYKPNQQPVYVDIIRSISESISAFNPDQTKKANGTKLPNSTITHLLNSFTTPQDIDILPRVIKAWRFHRQDSGALTLYRSLKIVRKCREYGRQDILLQLLNPEIYGLWFDLQGAREIMRTMQAIDPALENSWSSFREAYYLLPFVTIPNVKDIRNDPIVLLAVLKRAQIQGIEAKELQSIVPDIQSRLGSLDENDQAEVRSALALKI